jgi:hypothetical protein
MNKMPAGRYYVGDLCYVMHDVWDEFCDLTIDDNRVNDGVFTLADGRRFATFTTKWGDGYYKDNFGRGYGVDAGLIGCILESDICDPAPSISGGQIIDFKEDFEVDSVDGEIMFGDVYINTDGSDEDEWDDDTDTDWEEY